MTVSHECASLWLTQANRPLVFVPVSALADMEDAIKELVTTFIKSSRGKANLDSKSFQKMVSSNLGNVMAVTITTTTALHSSPPPSRV